MLAMKKIIFILAILAAGGACNIKNPDPGNLNTSGTEVTVNLIANDNPTLFSKTVILYDGNYYLIKTPLTAFLSGYPFILAGYGDLKAKAINDGILKDTLFLTEYLKSSGDSIKTIANYLQTGNCYLYDKQSQTGIKTIHYSTYKNESPVDTKSGRRFYIESKLFLETVDTLINF
jgi:hypothetical protein